MTTDDQYVPSEDDVRARYVFAGLPDRATSDQIARARDREVPEFDRFLARVRRDAEREAYTTARSVLAGEDTVEWARGAHGSSMSYPHAIGIMDGLIEDLDEEVSP